MRSDRSDFDLLEIWDYISADRPSAADKLIREIEASYRLLAENPMIGPARYDLARGLRYFVVGRYLVFYAQVAGGVEIVRVVHGARNLPALFGEGS